MCERCECLYLISSSADLLAHQPHACYMSSVCAGTSVVLYRNDLLRQHQYFSYPTWSGGLYVTPTLAGSRPGALSVACWASMVSLGESGYMDITRQIAHVTKEIAHASKQIEGLQVLGKPQAMIVAVKSSKFDIFAWANEMARRGFGWSSCQQPACDHLCTTPAASILVPVGTIIDPNYISWQAGIALSILA